MTLQPFTRNFADNSEKAGFQFTFFCGFCQKGYTTKFIESKTHKKARLLGGLVRAASIGETLLGKSILGKTIDKGSDILEILAKRYKGMSPAWHQEHESAFELAQNEAKQHFHCCPKCNQWVCKNDWNELEGLCVDDAVRINVEVASAKAQKAVQDIMAKAAGTQVFTGKIESKQTLCPQCGKPAGEGKFCNNCGVTLTLLNCAKCGAQSPFGTRFCGECGTKFG